MSTVSVNPAASISSKSNSAVFSGFLNRSRILRIAATARPVSRAMVSAIKASDERASMFNGLRTVSGKSFRLSVTIVAA